MRRKLFNKFLVNINEDKVTVEDLNDSNNLNDIEDWDILKDGRRIDVIEAIARRGRKYRGSLITETQGVRDCYASTAAIAASENSYWQVMLEQEKELAGFNKLKNQGMSIEDAIERIACSGCELESL